MSRLLPSKWFRSFGFFGLRENAMQLPRTNRGRNDVIRYGGAVANTIVYAQSEASKRDSGAMARTLLQ